MICGRLFLLLLCGQTFAIPQYNMPEGVTAISQKIFDLHMLVFYVCVAIGVVTFAVMFYSIVKHRRSQGHAAHQFDQNIPLEVVWTVIPLIIVLAMIYPSAKTLFEMEDTADSELTIKVTGYQWNWRYEYMNENISFFSNLSTPQAQIDGHEKKGPWYLLEVDEPMVIPIHTKVRLLFTSNDVNHSWWVPDFGVKVDCLPGYINEGWVNAERAGTFRGQCTELCGMRHGYMPIVVVAKTKEEYKQWVAEKTGQGKSKKVLSPMERGKKIYMNHCSSCHQPTGLGMPPAIKALKGSPVVTGEPKKQIHILLYGVQGSAMQSFADRLDDQELADVINYTKKSWGNDDKDRYGPYAGTTVTAEEVGEMRKEMK